MTSTPQRVDAAPASPPRGGYDGGQIRRPSVGTRKNSDLRGGASGAGGLVTKTTSVSGVATFTLKPTKLGLVTFRVSRSGFATKTFTKKVYAR